MSFTSRQAVTSRAVRRHLRERGLSQAALAEVLGMTQQTLSARLTGRRRWSAEELDQLVSVGVPLPALGDLTAGVGVVS